MAIAEPFCDKYKPSVRADGSCYWEEEPTSSTSIVQCGATEEGKNIIYWDSHFNKIDKAVSAVTEFNLVSMLYFASSS